MALTSGTRLGPYEIVAALGAGGMGEVYRARDTKLDRDVAIKILPEIFAQDPERLARFEREAKTLASLNHANIAQIFGIEERALVMELVEGDDLSVLIARGPIPLAETLPIARQIADALEAAHEQGIVHRDLKPANIKVRPNGTVKVLDFGLAKAMDAGGASGPGDAAMNSPTLTARATQMGMIIGTAAYMAPEQAKGKAVDKRADVWAFGVVLYEMLTGRRAFAGDDVSETLASVLKDTPSIASLPADVPPSVRRLLRRCLEKDRAKRLDSMAAARLEIDDALAGEPAAVASATTQTTRRRLQPAMLAGAVGLALLTGAAAWSLKPAVRVALPVARFSVTLPANTGWSRAGRHSIAVSPDGTHLAYIADNKLFLRKLDQFDAVPLSSVSDPAEVFFSSDSAWVGFFADGMLQKAALTGGAPVPLCPISMPSGASWNEDAIVFGQEKGIYRVPATGGTPELIVPRDGPGLLSTPQLLPGGQAVMYTKSVAGTWNDADILVEQVSTHEKTVLLRGGTDARYLPGGYLVYVRSGEILAARIDLSMLKVIGTPVSLLADVLDGAGGPTGAAQFGVTATGTLVYAFGTALEDSSLVWADLKGGRQPLAPDKGSYAYPRVSPDGSRLAFNQLVAGNVDVFILEWARNSKIRLTKEAGSELSPVWSYDSKRVAYSAARDAGAANLYWRAADGSDAEERLSTSPNLQVPFSWSRDGETLFFVEQTPQNGNDIYALPLTGDRKPRPLVTTPFDDRRPAISPDGHWLAYGSNELGVSEIHVRPYPDVDRARYQASAGGGTSPLWSIDGHAIFYRLGTKVFRVSVTTSPEFKAGKPEEVVTATAPDGTMNYDLAPDGKRFAIIQTGENRATAEYRVVLNWIEELKTRVEPKK